MEISGKIIQILPAETGEGRNGPWKKQSFIIETQEQFPKKVCIQTWGDKINLNDYQEGDMVTVGVNIESREYNSRWYTDVKAWRMNRDESTQQTPSTISNESLPPPPDFDDFTDDLPF